MIEDVRRINETVFAVVQGEVEHAPTVDDARRLVAAILICWAVVRSCQILMQRSMRR